MKKIFLFLIIIVVCIFLYGHYVEINNFKIHEYTIDTKDIPESFKDLKIVHFSDLLYEPSYSKNLEKLVNNINQENADIIIFSGDLFKDGIKYSDEDYKYLSDNLKKIKASLYKYAALGDNDEKFLDKYKDILYDADFKLLNDESTLLFYKDETPINIVGITNPNKIEELLTKDEEYNYSLVITHKPDNITYLSNYDVDTILSGHSLGGLVNVPYYGGLIKKDGAETYINGTYEVNNTNLYISNGLGYENFNFRLFNTPSINVYRFK